MASNRYQPSPTMVKIDQPASDEKRVFSCCFLPKSRQAGISPASGIRPGGPLVSMAKAAMNQKKNSQRWLSLDLRVCIKRMKPRTIKVSNIAKKGSVVRPLNWI